MPRALLLDAADNVATALEPLRPGASVEFILKGAPFGSPVTVENEIPFGFKVSVKTIQKRGSHHKVRPSDRPRDHRHRAGTHCSR